jgi:hypothetical protein
MKYLGHINANSPIIAFDVRGIILIVEGAMVGTFLFGMQALNWAFSFAVYAKIQKAKASMSRETYRMQKSLTYVLVLQVYGIGQFLNVQYCSRELYRLPRFPSQLSTI